MTRPFRTVAAASLAAVACAATPAHAALTTWLDAPLPWNVWLGIASGSLLVVGLALAVSRRKDGGDGDVYRFDRPRREPMPLYEEGSAG
jgi:hypothetical protein